MTMRRKIHSAMCRKIIEAHRQELALRDQRMSEALALRDKRHEEAMAIRDQQMSEALALVITRTAELSSALVLSDQRTSEALTGLRRELQEHHASTSLGQRELLAKVTEGLVLLASSRDLIVTRIALLSMGLCERVNGAVETALRTAWRWRTAAASTAPRRVPHDEARTPAEERATALEAGLPALQLPSMLLELYTELP